MNIYKNVGPDLWQYTRLLPRRRCHSTVEYCFAVCRGGTVGRGVLRAHRPTIIVDERVWGNLRWVRPVVPGLYVMPTQIKARGDGTHGVPYIVWDRGKVDVSSLSASL